MADSQDPRAQVPVRAGDVVRLQDEDYRYGRGPLVVRVLAIHNVQKFPDGIWVFLRGMQLRSDGSEVGERDVLVSMVALRRQH
jgi:hypothetical protein